VENALALTALAATFVLGGLVLALSWRLNQLSAELRKEAERLAALENIKVEVIGLERAVPDVTRGSIAAYDQPARRGIREE
jgi:hypothetical protein